MDSFTVKVEEDYEDKPIPFPDVRCPPPVDPGSSLDHEFFEIKVELEDESIKQEEEPLVKEEEPELKEEEPQLKEEEPQLKEEEPEEDYALPQIVAVSGNNTNYEQYTPPGPGLDQTSQKHPEKRKADENAGPTPKSPRSSDATAADAVEDSYDCTFCGEKFARKPRLSKHILAAHLDELLVKCPQCNMEFANKRSLANHQKFHTGEKYFCCGRCGEAFKYVSNYVSHMNDHMGAQPYECGECGAGFSSKRRVNLHMDTRHSPFWPYKCDTCLKPFLEKKKFLRHQKSPCVKRENCPEASDV